jgi:hypothetical protein
MRKLMFLVVFGLIGAGQMKADPTCTPGTLASYETNITTQANGCTIGGLNFWLFNGSNAGTGASGPGSTPFNASQFEVTPVAGIGGVGFLITPINTNGFEATATGVEDLEIPFEVACADGSNCLASVFMTISGSATVSNVGGGTDGAAVLTETYCAGGAAPPATAPCFTQDSLAITPGGPGTLSRTDTFSPVSRLSINKDLSATGNNGTSTITAVEDLFLASPQVLLVTPTPEPNTILLLGMGLAGLAFFSARKRQAR